MKYGRDSRFLEGVEWLGVAANEKKFLGTAPPPDRHETTAK